MFLRCVRFLSEEGRNLMRRAVIGVLGAMLLLQIVFPTEPMAYEQPKYIVTEADEDFELRQYETYLVVETIVEGDTDEAGSEGFRRLFKFISGENKGKQKISMTAPVSQEARPEKIPMTVPVSQEKVGKAWGITFVLPSRYTLDTVPQPLDPRITVKEVPQRLVAAITYSGTWSIHRFEKKKALLLEYINKKGLIATGEAQWARYNSPFSLWFLRRNEVLIPVQTGK
jgi:hypothetical protein